MEIEMLMQSYKHQLVKAGVEFHRAEQAAKILTWEDLQLVSEIWPEWAASCVDDLAENANTFSFARTSVAD
jgi:hypothetical protein